MKKILVTTDFSANSKAGIRFGLQLASQLKSELIFYHVIEIMKPTSWNNERFKIFAQIRKREFNKKLEKFVLEIETPGNIKGIKIKYVSEIGTNIDEMIIGYAKKIRANLICTGTQGAGKIKKLFGTNASNLIIDSPKPVVVVPKSYRMKPITTLFYASDFSSLSRELNIVQKLALPLKSKVDVYHYDYLPPFAGNRKKLERKAAPHLSKSVSFNIKRPKAEHSLSYYLKTDIESKKPSVAILFTKQNRNWFDRLFVRSNSVKMVFNPTVPLFVFRKTNSATTDLVSHRQFEIKQTAMKRNRFTRA